MRTSGIRERIALVLFGILLGVIMLGAGLQRDCPDSTCRGPLVRDGHPIAGGYHRAAQTIVTRLADASAPESDPASTEAPTADRLPNILFLMADELRGDALGSSGNPIVKTPNLDRLARESVRFTSTYSAAPICSPDRATLFTGQYPHVHGVVDNNIPLARIHVALPELLRTHGYTTAIVGKLHLIHEQHEWFDDEKVTMGGSGAAYREFLRERMPGIEGESDAAVIPGTLVESPRGHFRIGTSRVPEPLSEEAWVADRAIDFLTRQQESASPWFLFVSMNRPHSPFVIPEPYATMYRPEEMILPRTFRRGVILPEGPAVNPRHFINDEGTLRAVTAHYYGAVTMVDAQMGRVLDALDELGMRDRTIVVFTSDHGNMLGERNRMFKTLMYEGSTRVPLLIRAPKKLGAGEVVTAPNDHASILPTLLELSGLPVPDGIQGRSLVPLAEGGGSGADATAFSVFRDRMVVWRRWKLIDPAGGLVPGIAPSSGPELYDLEEDPDEEHNLYGQLEVAEVQRRLEAMLSDWWGRDSASVGLPNSGQRGESAAVPEAE